MLSTSSLDSVLHILDAAECSREETDRCRWIESSSTRERRRTKPGCDFSSCKEGCDFQVAVRRLCPSAAGSFDSKTQPSDCTCSHLSTIVLPRFSRANQSK